MDGGAAMRYRAGVVAALIVGSLGIGSGVARGQDAAWVGRKIVTKYPTPLRVGGQVVDDGAVFHVYNVEQVSADWLWVVKGSVCGWVRSSEVIPFDQAIDVYTQEIGADPSAARAYRRRGLIRLAKDETDAALADFNEAIRLEPTNSEALEQPWRYLVREERF